MNASRRIALLVLLVLGLAVSALPGFAAEETSPVDVAKQMMQAMSQAVDKGDADAVAALYSEKAVILFPTGKTASGREAIRKSYADNQKTGTNKLVFKGARAYGGGPQVTLIWTWDLTITPKEKKPTVFSGRSLIYMQRLDGTWQIVADMFQANQVKQ